MARRSLRALAAAASLVIPFSVTTLGSTASAAEPPPPVPGDPLMTLAVSDSYAGGSPTLTFERAYSGETPDGTPVYVYVPVGTLAAGGDSTGIRGLDPTIDPTPGDEFTPCATNSPADFSVTQTQLTALGQELATHIVAVDEAQFGPVGGDATNDDPLVMLVYNDFDTSYYVCDEPSYTAGYFSDTFIEQYGINAIVIDAYDWANRLGDQSDNPDGQSYLYEGVVAHELQHLLHSYSDPGELSWVDEGLADFAIFQNGYDVGGSHLTYHQVFHRETSLTRWAGGLENYGAAYTYFQYVWEQAGGNGDGTYDADGEYSGAGGDLLIKLIFQNAADGMAGVDAAIAQFNAQTGATLRSAEDLFKDWSIAIYLDDEGSDLYDIKAVDFGDPASTPWTIDLANSDFFDGRGQYAGRMPEPRWNKGNVPAQTALPFGTSYETFRNLGPTFSARLTGDATTRIAPHSEPTHWYAGYFSGVDNVLDVDLPGSTASPTVTIGGQELDFWSWWFIEEGWDYGFVEAQVDGQWVTVPLVDDSGATVTTNDDPQGANTEGNGLTGTSGGEYFVDDPEYVHLHAELPAGTTDVRFRYSTDQAYLDTGWFVDDVQIDGSAVGVSSDTWKDIAGVQNNDFSLQLVSSCDLTPGVDSPGEQVDTLGTHVYQLEGSDISAAGFTTCGKGNAQDVVAVISNLTSGDLDALDADYSFRLVGGPAKGAAKKPAATTSTTSATTSTTSTTTAAKKATVQTAVVLGPPTGVTKAFVGPVAAPTTARTFGPPTGLART